MHQHAVRLEVGSSSRASIFTPYSESGRRPDRVRAVDWVSHIHVFSPADFFAASAVWLPRISISADLQWPTVQTLRSRRLYTIANLDFVRHTVLTSPGSLPSTPPREPRNNIRDIAPAEDGFGRPTCLLVPEANVPAPLSRLLCALFPFFFSAAPLAKEETTLAPEPSLTTATGSR